LTPASVISTPSANVTMTRINIFSGTSLRSATTATAPDKVSVATTRPPTMGSVVPVAARTTEGMSEK